MFSRRCRPLGLSPGWNLTVLSFEVEVQKIFPSVKSVGSPVNPDYKFYSISLNIKNTGLSKLTDTGSRFKDKVRMLTSEDNIVLNFISSANKREIFK